MTARSGSSNGFARWRRFAFDYAVIPGITSIQALAASHRIPLNLVGKPVEITTGRRLMESFPHRNETAVVMLDGEQAFMKIEDPDARIYWGAYLGTDQEIILSGRLADVKDEILKTRGCGAGTAWLDHGYLSSAKGRRFRGIAAKAVLRFDVVLGMAAGLSVL